MTHNGNGNGAQDAPSTEQLYQQIAPERRFSAQPVKVRFPTGAEAFVRPVGLDVLVKSGRLPDFLTPMVMDGLNGKPTTMPTVDEVGQVKDLFALIDTIAELAFVLPRVVEVPANDTEITVDDIPLDDKYFLFELLGKPRRWLENFRPQPERDVRPVADEPGLPVEAAEPNAEVEASAEA